MAWLGGCAPRAALDSVPLASGVREPQRGIAYALPKKLVTLEVWGVAEAARPASAAETSPRPAPPPSPPLLPPPPGLVVRYFGVLRGESLVPDVRHQFLIQARHDAASHDTLEVQVGPDGLLASVRSRTEDQRADIVRDLARLAALLLQGPAAGLGTTRSLFVREGEPHLAASLTFDPVDPIQWTDALRRLGRYGVSMSLTRQADCRVATSGADCHHACAACQPGIYYRLPLAYRLHLVPAGSFRAGDLGREGGWELLDGGHDHTLLLPNEAACLYVPADRWPFVTSATSMTFDRGMLTRVTSDKPSEAVGLVRIPVEVAATLMAVPADLLTLRIQQTELLAREAETSRGRDEAEARRLRAELDLLHALTEYRKTATDGGSPDAP